MVTTKIQPTSPEIEFILENSVNFVNFPKKLSQEEIDNFTLINITLPTLVLKKHLKRNTSIENIDMLTYLNKMNGKYEKEQIMEIVDKLNHWDEISNDIKANLVAWSQHMRGDLRARILIEAPKFGYIVNIPSLFHNVLANPKIEFSPTSPYYTDYNKLSDFVARKQSKEMTRQS